MDNSRFISVLLILQMDTKDSPDSLIDDSDLVNSNEFVLDNVEVEHSDTDLLLHIASLY
jgi:hypothetical protein